MSPAAMPAVRAVLLAGGTGSRLGGADKALLRSGGDTLMGHWAEALVQRGIDGVVVGPEHLRQLLPSSFVLTREDPPLSGPAAAVCAGVRALDAQATVGGEHVGPQDVLLLLAVDVVNPAALLDWLLQWLPALESEQAIIPRDQQGRFQMLGSAINHHWLSQRVAGLNRAQAGPSEEVVPDEEVGQSLRWLIGDASTAHPVLDEGLGLDVDTPEDAQRLNVDLGQQNRGGAPDDRE